MTSTLSGAFPKGAIPFILRSVFMKAGILAKMEAAVAVMQPNEAMIDQADDYRTLFERERARANEERARAECLEAALQDAREAMAQSDKQFKNFHRLLCERFDYVHDE